ncbi:hypothetical protein C8R43DRAFT_1128771 [Mycena crocata]|nr:hypothetical protein C8R43DRAFT_1128771 [Mycena crocata]
MAVRVASQEYISAWPSPSIYATIAISMFAGATHIRREPVTFADIRPSPSIDHSAQVSNTALGPKIISFLFYDPIATPCSPALPTLTSDR